MNPQKLAQLNAENAAARLYFSIFAQRRRSFPQTTVQEVIDLARRENQFLTPPEVEAFFEGLEAANCGRFLRDAAGHRFVWLGKARDVARAAHRQPFSGVEDTQNIAVPALDPIFVTHTLRLRADCIIHLDLPADLSAEEARRLCHFLVALPLDAPIPTMEAPI